MDKVVHFEICVDDVNKARDFYSKMFGWKINQVSDTPPYYMITTVEADEKYVPKEPGAINGGMMPRSSPNESSIVVANVSSIDDSLTRTVELGGKVVIPKLDIGTFGYYARISDLDGNIVGLWQNKN